MKKSFKIFGTLVAIVAMSLFLYSCDDEEDFQPGEPDLDGCYGVYFVQEDFSGLEIDPDDPREITITAARENSYDAITVPLEISNDYDGIFTVTPLTFANGQSESEITLSFENADVGVEYSLSIEITDPQYASLYSSNVPGVDISLSIVKWNSLGMAEFCDWFFFYNENEDTTLGGYMVEVQQNDLNPLLFRLIDPYVEGLANPYEGWYIDAPTKNYMTFQILEAGKTLGEQLDNTSSTLAITLDNLVYFPPYNPGCYYDYYEDYIWLYHPAHFTSSESNFECNKVVRYQASSDLPALVQLAPYYYLPDYGGYWNYSSYDEVVWILFPGAELADYSVEVSVTSTDFDVTAYVELGEDVESARVAFIEGDEIDATVTAIKNGTIDYEEITASSELSFTAEVGGVHSVVAVTYAEGTAQESGYGSVRVIDPNETWSLYGYGDYHYGDVLFSGDDPALEIYQSNSFPERFKIEHWGYDVDFYFTWDQETNEVVVLDQETGYTYSFYGMTSVDDVSDYYGTGASTYSNGVFYFSVVYYCSAGEFGFCLETFTLTDGAMYTLSDLVGTYFVDGISYFGEDYDVEGYPWVIEESDDPDWDIMLTYYNGWPCDPALYGDFDTATGVFTIYSGTTGQYFYNYLNVYDIYFVSYNAVYYSRYGYDSGEFQLLPNGTFIGPLEADLVGEYLYDHGTTNSEGWNQLFEFVYGEKYSSATNLFKASAQTGAEKEAKVVNKKIDYTPLTIQKVKIDSTVKKEAASTTEDSSAKSGKAKVKNTNNNPVQGPAPKSL